MLHSLDQARCASLPLESVPALAGLRCAPGVRIALTPERAWLQWPESNEDVLPYILPIQGARFYIEHEGVWYQVGRYLPAADLPVTEEYQPLAGCLSPAPFQPEPVQAPSSTLWHGLLTVPLPAAGGEGMVREDFQPPTLQLVADHRIQPTAAMLCELAIVKKWAESPTVSAFVLESLRAARCEKLVLLLGERLPLLPGCRRLWGQMVLIPIGYRLEPLLPESLVRSALGVNDDEILLFETAQPEVISMDALQPLSRIGVRQALLEQT